MKILIAYDGSESADKGIDDLSRAGLPSEADALVVTFQGLVTYGPAWKDVLNTFASAHR